jgi:hypothetical protein
MPMQHGVCSAPALSGPGARALVACSSQQQLQPAGSQRVACRGRRHARQPRSTSDATGAEPPSEGHRHGPHTVYPSEMQRRARNQTSQPNPTKSTNKHRRAGNTPGSCAPGHPGVGRGVPFTATVPSTAACTYMQCHACSGTRMQCHLCSSEILGRGSTIALRHSLACHTAYSCIGSSVGRFSRSLLYQYTL